MDPQNDLPDLVEDLEVNIDELSDILAPLLSTPLSTTASSLPLLDKSKLYVLAAYSIESLLYSSLQASGVNAKEHAIFQELARLKGYFGKIKEIEGRGTPAQQPRNRLDVSAASRFIKHGLAGNDKYDLERAERQAKEKARASLKAAQINRKFDEAGETIAPAATGTQQMEAEAEAQDDDEDVLQGLEEPESTTSAKPASKETVLSVAAGPMDIDSAPSPTTSALKHKRKHESASKETLLSVTAGPMDESESPIEVEGATKKKKKHRGGKKRKSSQPTSEVEAEAPAAEERDEAQPGNDEAEADTNTAAPPARQTRQKRGKKKKSKSTETSDIDMEGQDEPESAAEPPKKKRKQRGKKGKMSSGIADEVDEASEESIPAGAPKTRSATFNALLDGSMSEKQKKGKSGSKKK
jgi:exosome complex protein LRP1